ncbi:MAG: hypothetical protein H0W88_03875 [Parachlamydiaceae bacterium]|nr:hypothetical protein [Parachlamydiaceae bacterium]
MKNISHIIFSVVFVCLCSFLNTPKVYSEVNVPINVPKGSFLLVESDCNCGMFASFSFALGSLHFYDKGNFAGLKVNFTCPIYLDKSRGSNWWEYFFEPICLGNQNAPNYIFSVHQYIKLAGYGFRLSRNEASAIIEKYIRLKPHIQEEVNKYVNDNFHKKYVIGVHYRGTDKCTENKLVPYEQFCNKVRDVIAESPMIKKRKLVIFVATDEEDFLNYIKKNIPLEIVYNDFKRSNDNTSLHHGEHHYENNYEKGREALLDCLILSRCDYLIKTASSLSHMSANFNPKIPVKIVRVRTPQTE